MPTDLHEFAERFPDIPASQLDEARANLDRYIAVALRVNERLAAQASGGLLTDPPPSPTMRGERSKQKKSNETG